MSNDITMGEIIGCDNLVIAKIVQDTRDAFVTGTPEYFAPVGEVKDDPKVSSSNSAYDNSIMFNYYSEGGELSVTVPGLSERRAAEVTGKSYDPAKGIVFDSGDLAHIPAYALGFRVEVGSDSGESYYKYRWFLKGNFSISSTTAKSKGEKVDGQSQEVTFNPLRTVHKWTVPHPKDASKTISTGLKVVKTDTTDPAFSTEDSWFSQVQTPDTIGAPAALTLSAVPANNATGVLATAKPTLTFNNVIADYSGITLVSNNAVVTAPITVDSTGKILTLTPSASLTSGAIYTIVLAGVTDVYGQALATQAIKFTVA